MNDYLPKIKSGFVLSAIIASMSSLSDECWLMVFPHFSHLWIITKPLPSGVADIGFIMPPQSAARSPGLLSTCRDHRHLGQ